MRCSGQEPRAETHGFNLSSPVSRQVIWQMCFTWHYLVEGEPFPGMPSESLYIRSKSTPIPNSSVLSNTSASLFGLNLPAFFECELPERDTTLPTCQSRRDRHSYLLKQPSTEKAFWTGKSPQKSNLYVWKCSNMQFQWVGEPTLLGVRLHSSILATHITSSVSSQHLLHSWMQSVLISCSRSSLFSPMLPFLPHFSFPLLLNFCKTCSFEPATNGGKILCVNMLSLLPMPALS